MGWITTRFPKARKDHRCFGCLEVIPKGTVHHLDVCVDGGQIFSTRMCDACLEYLKDMDYGPDDSFCEGDLRERFNDEG
jgi:hypothetical protein